MTPDQMAAIPARLRSIADDLAMGRLTETMTLEAEELYAYADALDRLVNPTMFERLEKEKS